MIETHCLKNVVTFIQTILSFVLSRKTVRYMAIQSGNKTAITYNYKNAGCHVIQIQKQQAYTNQNVNVKYETLKLKLRTI